MWEKEEEFQTEVCIICLIVVSSRFFVCLTFTNSLHQLRKWKKDHETVSAELRKAKDLVRDYEREASETAESSKKQVRCILRNNKLNNL